MKDIAKELFVEVIKEIALQLSTNLTEAIRMLTTEISGLLKAITDDAIHDLLRFISFGYKD